MEILRAPPSSNQCTRSEEHTSELQSQSNIVCRLLLEKKKVVKRTSYEVIHCSAGDMHGRLLRPGSAHYGNTRHSTYAAIRTRAYLHHSYTDLVGLRSV